MPDFLEPELELGANVPMPPRRAVSPGLSASAEWRPRIIGEETNLVPIDSTSLRWRSRNSRGVLALLCFEVGCSFLAAMRHMQKGPWLRLRTSRFSGLGACRYQGPLGVVVLRRCLSSHLNRGSEPATNTETPYNWPHYTLLPLSLKVGFSQANLTSPNPGHPQSRGPTFLPVISSTPTIPLSFFLTRIGAIAQRFLENCRSERIPSSHRGIIPAC